jgi:hypothetical protein
VLLRYVVYHLLFVSRPQSVILPESLLEASEPTLRSAAVRKQLADVLLGEAYNPASIFYAIGVAEFLQCLGFSHCQWCFFGRRNSNSL